MRHVFDIVKSSFPHFFELYLCTVAEIKKVTNSGEKTFFSFAHCAMGETQAIVKQKNVGSRSRTIG